MPDTAVELVEKAVANHAFFKQVASKLERLPPDAAAANAVVAAFRKGEAPPWLTACLLGCIGHDAGYEVVREILLEAPGQLAESYAGSALVKIAGARAFDDLCGLLEGAAKLSSRKGAACGLGRLKSERATAVLLRAARAGAIPGHVAAWNLARLPLAPDQILELLHSSDPESLRLGTEIVWAVIRGADASRLTWLAANQRQLAAAVRLVLTNPTFKMAPRKRRVLTEWAAMSE